jgi:adenylate cyclase
MAWLVMQVADVILNNIEAPGWVFQTILLLLGIGFLVAMFFSWAFEMTPEGLKREHEVDRSQSITPQTGMKLNNLIFTVMALAIAYFAYDKFVLDASRDAALVEATTQAMTEQATGEGATRESDNSIAVLPFVNMSDDAGNEYFADGLTEELLNSLARIKELKVTGRTSSFAFKGQNTDLREIGQTLGVDHILEGSVRKVQNRVRITAQLIKTEDGYHMWSDTFDRELDDIFAIQEEIATRVVNELTTTLLGSASGQLVHAGTNNTQAYESYLRARYMFLRKPDDPTIQNEAERLYQQALDLDPGFTLAWFGRFTVLNYRQRSGNIDYQEGAIYLRELADKMAAMDAELPETLVSLSRVAVIEMNWSEAETVLNQALVINPGSIDVLNGLSSLMTLLKRNSEALKFALQGQARDPLNLQALHQTTIAYTLMGQCAEATQIAGKALSLVPEADRFFGTLGRCWMTQHGEYQKAIDLIEKEPLNFMRLTGLAIAFNKLGQQDKAQQYLDELTQTEGEKASYQFGQIYAQWGDTERALDALEHAWEIKDTGFILLNMDNSLDPLRDHPRFIALQKIWQNPSGS